MIARVLKVSGRNVGENEALIDSADNDAIDEVEHAYNDVKVIDYLDISEQGNNSWEAAKKRFVLVLTVPFDVESCRSMLISVP